MHIAMNSVDSLDVKNSCVNECNNCLELDTKLLKKKDLIEKDVYDKLLKSYSTLEKHCISLELTTQLNQEIFQKDNFRENQNVPTFNQLFEINELKAQLQEKDTVIRKLKDMIKSLSGKDNVENVKKDIDEIETINIELEHTLKNELRKLKGKNVVDTAVSKPSATIASGIFKLDIDPISHRLKNNRDAHDNIPKQTDSLKPKDSNKPLLPSTGVKPTTIASELKPSGNTNNNRITRPPSSNQKNKVEEHPRKVKSSLNKINFVSEPNSNAHVKHSVNDVNVHSKSKSKRNKKRNVWKPTGKVFSKIRYSWKPTGRTFTIVRNKCPLTRFTSTKEVPLKETTITPVITQSPPLKVYSRKSKASRSVGSSSKAKIVESKTSNNEEPKQFWGSTVFDVPSSSLIDCKFRNDHIAKIMGYGDYQMRNFIISQVYYVEGVGHNLFSMGQFCDSDLEVAFRKHTYFIRDLEGVDLLKRSWGLHLYTLSMDNLLLSSPICPLSKASKTKTDNGTEFVNQTLRAYYEEVKISHQTSVARTLQQNCVVKRRNRTLVEAARTMLIFSKALLFLWVEAVATACYTQNRSLIRKHHNKTPYELLHDRKPDLSYLHVFGALCYPTNDGDDLGKLKPKADIGIFIGYALTKKAFRIYNKRTRVIIKTIHVDFDELTAMDSKEFSSRPGPKLMTLGIISSGLVQNIPSLTPYVPPTNNVWEILFQPMFDEYLNPPPCFDPQVPIVIAP
ncbi:retrovirus-related pol polyprotein from transposon TNT 1-94 [Tanacetum coccineum]